MGSFAEGNAKKPHLSCTSVPSWQQGSAFNPLLSCPHSFPRGTFWALHFDPDPDFEKGFYSKGH